MRRKWGCSNINDNFYSFLNSTYTIIHMQQKDAGTLFNIKASTSQRYEYIT